MRINVYTEELLPGDSNEPKFAEIVVAEYVSSRTGQPMKNYGLRIFVKSHPDLHYIPPRDDDRSAITFWCGVDREGPMKFWQTVKDFLEMSSLDLWRAKTEAQQQAAEAALEQHHERTP